MASFFTLNLDTQGPQTVTFVLNGNAQFATSTAATGAITTADGSTSGYQMKIWGDVAVGGGLAATEGAATWIAYNAAPAITLSSGDGLKTVNVRLRDDVLNESSVATDTITLDTSVPVITITGPDVTKISKIAGKNVASFSFSPNVALTAYKVKVVPANNSLENAGTQIPTAAGSTNMSGGAVTSGGTVSCTINGTDLETASSGDGAKIIKVFGQNAAGNWSVA